MICIKSLSAQHRARPGAGPGAEGGQLSKALCSQSFHSRALPASVNVRSPGGRVKCIFPGPSLGNSSLRCKQVLEINSNVIHESHSKKQQIQVDKESNVFLLRIFSIWKMNGNPWGNFENHLERELLIVIS